MECKVGQNMKKIVLGILAHVDAGKTTLSESLLYQSGSIRTLGRVDHQDAFLDYDQQERKRGITIFSKQAIFDWKETEITIIDTPGHVDFSAEMERTLQVLDYAIIVINGLDGVQVHTKTIWKLLQHYQVPTFIFVNKTDMGQVNQEEIYQQLKESLDSRCIDFTAPIDNLYENIALTSDSYLDYYLKHNKIANKMITKGITKREIVPCYFGSALKMIGVVELLDGLSTYSATIEYPANFGAKVYKISRDEQGNKLTHMKITGGSLKVKSQIMENEKVDQIRRYSGYKYTMVDEVLAGNVCVVKGLQTTVPGQGLGFEVTNDQAVLSSYVSYRIVLPPTCDEFVMLKHLQQLSQEDPQLHIRYQSQTKEIYLQLMGEVQIEVLKNIIKERFGVAVTFDQGRILYKESIAQAVEGIGHYEPLGHYAEVHLLLEPGELDSGLQFASNCPEDILDRNYQRLIISHLAQKNHVGVLTGSLITDMKITLLLGKAHLKHTEGGDFRQATYRALRQGLKATKSILLEPYFQFQLEIPAEYLSKAIYDIEQMDGQYTMPKIITETIIITGSAPVAKMQNYHQEVISYTKGKGRLDCALKGYEPCRNQQEVIDTINYDSEADIENPTGSIFCSHGAGFTVPWDQVRKHMHVDSRWQQKREISDKKQILLPKAPISMDEKELESIFTRTYGKMKHRGFESVASKRNNNVPTKPVTYRPECLLVDGYNVIHAWKSLKELAIDNLDAARAKLIETMCNYQGFKQCIVIVVFDAYMVSGNLGTIQKYDNIYIVYTKEAQTADAYIERATHDLGDAYNIIVATSDALEQLIVVGQGARRMSSRELEKEVAYMHTEQVKEFERKKAKGYNYLLEDIKGYKQ